MLPKSFKSLTVDVKSSISDMQNVRSELIIKAIISRKSKVPIRGIAKLDISTIIYINAIMMISKTLFPDNFHFITQEILHKRIILTRLEPMLANPKSSMFFKKI